MSERRALRLFMSVILLVGSVATIMGLAGINLGDGGLIMPVAAIGSLIGLIVIRPRNHRTTNRKERRNG